MSYTGGDGNDLTLTVEEPIPEPATWLLIALGTGPAVGIRVRKRRGGEALLKVDS